MATRRQSVPVPFFSAYEIALAQECALELWRGGDFESNSSKEKSDEELLNSFSGSFNAILQNPNTTNRVSEYEVRQLARVAKIKAFYRSTIPTDFHAGIRSVEIGVTQYVRQWRSRTVGATRKSHVLNAVINVARHFVTNTGPSLNGNYRVPLASRMLFYAVPEMPIFSFSNALAQKLKLQTRPQAAYPFFFDLMYKGIWTNRRRLSMLNMPTSSLLSVAQQNSLKKSRWWSRRVMDLALLNHLNLTSPKASLVQAARANAPIYR